VAHFTEQQVIDAATKQNGGWSVCSDMLDEAMLAPTLEEAVKVILLDTAYWEGRYLSDE